MNDQCDQKHFEKCERDIADQVNKYMPGVPEDQIVDKVYGDGKKYEAKANDYL